MNDNSKSLVQKPKTTVYKVAGKEVVLSHQIVRNYLTKGNGQVSDQDIVQFIGICKYNELNPFLGEAHLVKFGNSPAQMIVSKEALMKRADACEGYAGMQAGVIVLRNNEIVELEGTFYLPTDQLVGGWAKVYRKDREYPIVSKVRLDEYDKKQSSWNTMKGTMIAKVAKVQALREAFPSQLGAMYTQEESIIAQSTENVRETEQEEIIQQDEPVEEAYPEQPFEAQSQEPETPEEPEKITI